MGEKLREEAWEPGEEGGNVPYAAQYWRMLSYCWS